MQARLPRFRGTCRPPARSIQRSYSVAPDCLSGRLTNVFLARAMTPLQTQYVLCPGAYWRLLRLPCRLKARGASSRNVRHAAHRKLRPDWAANRLLQCWSDGSFETVLPWLTRSRIEKIDRLRA